MKLLFVDLDGTLNTQSSVRDPLIPHGWKSNTDWLPWHAAHINEAVSPVRVNLVKALIDDDWRLIIISNRDIKNISTTHKQLAHAGLHGKYAPYFIDLRQRDDCRTPGEMKAEKINSIIYFYKNQPYVVNVKAMLIDDDDHVVQTVGQQVPGIIINHIAKI